LPAWYADAGAEYWLTERAGFYLDATLQRSQSFDQNLGGRTATIDMSSTSGVTSGLTLRF
jgi:predicted porin